MSSNHIELALDSREQPIAFTRLLWSSAGSPWSGFRLERHAIGPVGRLSDFTVPEVLLGLCLRGSANLKFGSDLHGRQVRVRPGRFTLLVAGGEQPPIQWAGTRETLYLAMEGEQVDRLVGREQRAAGRRGAACLLPQYAVDDPQVARLMLNMADEAVAGNPAGKLYGDALCVALFDYLVKRYAARGAPALPSGGVLSHAMAARVVDYMQAHLDRNIALAELAALVGLSSHHFSLVFKNTFGATPHRHLLLLRLEKAKGLLESGEQSIGEAGLEVGFADQSHFTRMFRRLVGETPRRYQQSRS